MKKNILIIDDSALMRRVLSDIINSDERFLVTDFAINGLEGLEFMQKDSSRFDAIILDINMPKMNGIEFLEALKQQNIKATIIVVSTVAKEGAKETILALELGAFDFVTKPESFIEVKTDNFKKKILDCLSIATRMEVIAEPIEIKVEKDLSLVQSEREIKKKRLMKLSQGGNKLVALACSTGGPKALQIVIPSLPANLDASILIVQHMPEGFTKSLADRLNELSQVRVKEAEHGETIQKGTVYIAKGGYQMRLIKKEDGGNQLSITAEPARTGLKPCADILYESLQNTQYDEITCVVLTGMGGDGSFGIKQLNDTNNIYVIAQDEETCTVYGMPKVLYATGLVNEVVALSKISEAIIKNVGVN